MFNLFSLLIPIASFAIVVTIVVVAVRGLLQWNQNNRAPVLTVDARVVVKRTNTSMHVHDGHHHHPWHYVTFQVDSGERLEFYISGSEYGMLVEGDTGRLTFQRTRYLAFERHL